ncbi:hypothetical protein [Williamsia sp. CHRR-6]|uniref:hypothetical protein n=1 Tax=Williamsia sp. CHRR-6 TaxID=2835871 RepID=UPI001BD91E67|nr:hypothetical protein [Williamsia sp. CHRR-6]MBT0565874.1 hypothetical protein [Williamsia sp. CHRR-6]
MTRPRPPRKATPPRRTPKVAGRTPAGEHTAPTPAKKVVPATKAGTPGKKVVPATKAGTPGKKVAPATKAGTPATKAAAPAKKVMPAAKKAAAPAKKAPPPTAADDLSDTQGAETAETAAISLAAGEADTAVTEADAPAPDTDAAALDAAPATGSISLAKPPAGPRGKKRPPAARVSTIKPAATRPAIERVPVPATSRVRRRPTWKTVIALAVAAAVIAVIGLIATSKPGVSIGSNKAFVDSALTNEISGQAKSRICSIFGVKYDKLDEWERNARGNVTGTAAQRFGQYSKSVRDALTQAGLTQGAVDCRVDTVGVRSIDGDKAVLIVNLLFSQTDGQTAAGSGTKRYQVSVARVNGDWLISDFVDF